MLIPQDIIRKKRDNVSLSKQEIVDFVMGITNDQVSDAQISAFTMAVFFNSLTTEETINLTLAMKESGDVLTWNELSGPIVDKHSTGGVGDLVSLILAPMVASLGAYVPMITGRGLGHTGGTTDKLESIPGYQTMISATKFKQVVKQCGLAIIGQSASLAPADKRIYGVRDVTATTESIPLITSSILSKKLASGTPNLVMDIKIGNGAFMSSLEKAESLAKNIVNIGNGAGCHTSALITDMNQPLTSDLGNAIEIKKSIDYLTKKYDKDSRLHQINIELGAQMLIQTGLATNIDDAKQKCNQSINSGAAAEKFAQMCSLLGAPNDLIDNPDKYLQKAPIIKPIYSHKSGMITQIDTRGIGMVIVGLGGGRTKPNTAIDHRVGITSLVELGSKIDPQTPVAFIHAKDQDSFNLAEQKLLSSLTIDDNNSYKDTYKLVYQVIRNG